MAKTKNYSIRFDKEKLAFFQNSNPSLITHQQIVDFFLDEFWWRYNGSFIETEKVIPKNTPPLSNKSIKTELLNKPEEKSKAPDPSNKGAYLRYLKENQ